MENNGSSEGWPSQHKILEKGIEMKTNQGFATSAVAVLTSGSALCLP